MPWTILRVTQFHEFAEQVYARAKIGPFHVAPRMRTQPIAAREVADRLVALAEARPAGRHADIAGPREESLVEMVRGFAGRAAQRAWIPAIPLPGAAGRAQRDGSLLPGPGAILGTADLRRLAGGAAGAHRERPCFRSGIRCRVELIRRDPQVGLVAEVADSVSRMPPTVQQARIVHCIAVGASGK